VLAYVLLAVAQAVGIFLVPFGRLGVWIQLLAVVAFAWWTDFSRFGVVPVVILLTVGLTAEIAGAVLSAGTVSPDARKKLGFAGIGGAGLGAVGGISIPLLGSMFGALVGAAVGVLMGAVAVRPAAGQGGIGGLVAATTLRAAASIAIASFTILTLLR
jgi:hypothetical protein